MQILQKIVMSTPRLKGQTVISKDNELLYAWWKLQDTLRLFFNCVTHTHFAAVIAEVSAFTGFGLPSNN